MRQQGPEGGEAIELGHQCAAPARPDILQHLIEMLVREGKVDDAGVECARATCRCILDDAPIGAVLRGRAKRGAAEIGGWRVQPWTAQPASEVLGPQVAVNRVRVLECGRVVGHAEARTRALELQAGTRRGGGGEPLGVSGRQVYRCQPAPHARIEGVQGASERRRVGGGGGLGEDGNGEEALARSQWRRRRGGRRGGSRRRGRGRASERRRRPGARRARCGQARWRRRGA